METPKPSLTAAEIKKLFLHQLNRLNCTKSYLIKNLPHLKNMASFNNMKLAIQEIFEDVNKQQLRIDEVYLLLGSKASDDGCGVIKCVIEEAFKLGDSEGKSTIISDMDIILYMQLIENMESTSCKMLKIIAKHLNNGQVEHLITECFDENIDNERLFSLITEEYLSQKTV